MPRTQARNAVRSTVVDFVGDPLGARTALALGSWDARARAGLLSQAVVGEHGDPGKSFYGRLGHSLQRFVGESVLGANPVTYRDGGNTMDTQLADDGMADPARRLLAERLRRRR